MEVGSATFSVVTLGLGSFPRGVVGDFVLDGFPQTSEKTEVQWQESQQNFVVSGARFPGQDENLCTTSSRVLVTDDSNDVATMSWSNPCLLSGNTLRVQVEVPSRTALREARDDREPRAAADDGFFLCSTDLNIQQANSTFAANSFRLLDQAGNEVCRDLPVGSTLDAVLQVQGQSHLNFNGSFVITYRGYPVANFAVPPPAGDPQLAVSVEELIFAPTTNEPTPEQSLTVTNAGGGLLIGGMTLIAADSGGNEFHLISAATLSLGPGQSETVTIRFTPLSPDFVTGSLRITTNGGVRSVRLHGGQGSQPRLTVSPTSLDFGHVVIPETADRTLTVTNSGEGVLTGRVFLPTFRVFSVLQGETFSLGAQQSQTVTIRFVPPAAGTFTETAFVSSNVGEIAVSLTGSAAGPKLAVLGLKELYPNGPISLQGLDFGNDCNDATESFSVENVGEGTLIGTVTTSPPFRVKKGANFSLRAGQRQKVTIRLNWNPKNGQVMSGSVRIAANGGAANVSMFASCIKIKIR
ncbi:MAG: choice-of-anchor D domain-containing protein [Candidatus Binatia bacterium]